jgi:hypothetical protein
MAGFRVVGADSAGYAPHLHPVAAAMRRRLTGEARGMELQGWGARTAGEHAELQGVCQRLGGRIPARKAAGVEASSAGPPRAPRCGIIVASYIFLLESALQESTPPTPPPPPRKGSLGMEVEESQVRKKDVN